MGWEVGQRFNREGTYVYLWLIHVDVWQKLTQYCKTIILLLKIKKHNWLRIEGNFLTLIEGNYEKSIANVVVKDCLIFSWDQEKNKYIHSSQHCKEFCPGQLGRKRN